MNDALKPLNALLLLVAALVVAALLVSLAGATLRVVWEGFKWGWELYGYMPIRVK